MADNENMNSEELEQQAPSVPAAKKQDKPVKRANRKPNIFARIGKWFRELRAEARKVVWPTQKQVVNNTIVVIIMVIVVAAFVAVLDVSFQFVRNFLAGLV